MLLEIFFIGEGLFPADQRRKGADEIADFVFLNLQVYKKNIVKINCL